MYTACNTSMSKLMIGQRPFKLWWSDVSWMLRVFAAEKYLLFNYAQLLLRASCWDLSCLVDSADALAAQIKLTYWPMIYQKGIV